ncbi:MAG: Holliday junction resolvase RuvX [Acidimicrobiales bacterium]
MRVLGLDLGTVRIGVAVSDPIGIIASPHSVIRRGGDHGVDHDAIAALVSELEVGRVVVGLPLSMDGSLGPAATAALDEIDELGDRLAVPVEPYDERLTTVSAERSLREGGVRGRSRRDVIDKVAAAVILQSWLDGRPSPAPDA